MSHKSTKTRNRFSQLISGSESSSKRRSSSQITSPLSKKPRNKKGKAPESVPDNIPDPIFSSSSSSGKKRAEKDFEVSHLEEKLNTIFNQNIVIMKNIDKLLNAQENLEGRIQNLEKEFEDMNSSRSNSNSKTFVNVIKSF